LVLFAAKKQRQTAGMKKNIVLFLSILSALYGAEHNAFSQTDPKKNYKDPKVSTQVRANTLLALMTLDEKIGQMTQLCASSITLDGTKKLDLNVQKIREYILKQHVGSFLSGTGTAEKWVDFVRGIQEVAMNETRLGIPVLFGMDNVHGSNYTDEATMLPHNLNLGCTFNPALAEEAARITAIESADLGHIWNFAPVLDVGKNPYWPRLYETFGEDPLVCGTMGSAFIRSFQNCPEIAPYKLSACAKHFIGYSDPKSGWDRTPSEIPDQTLYETFVPPFKMAFDAGVKTLMVNSGELNGEAVHGSKRILTDLLRTELGFKGVILTDIKDILKMVEMHGAYANEEEATLASIQAGIDMSMACSSTDFCDILKRLVVQGKISKQRIDESVRRILILKFDLGLFEHPYPRKDRVSLIGSKNHYSKALESARQSIVLLKNEGFILPFKKESQRILVAGQASNSKRIMNGAWTLEWLGAEELRQPRATKTLLEALKTAMPQKTFEWVDSMGVERKSSSEKIESSIQDWKQKAASSDAIILAIGEQPYSEFKGNINDLRLSPIQEELVLWANESGKPLILILLEGRPRILPKITSDKHAIIFAGHPGVAGAEALAEILSGKYNPDGKLCFTYPKSVGHCVPYNHKKSEKYEPAFTFGHGLHFGEVLYSNLKIKDSLVSVSGTVSISVQIENTSSLPVKESVLVFNQDEVGRITRPVSKLALFRKVPLNPGEKRVIDVELKASDLCSYPDKTGKIITEPGFHTISVGTVSLRFKIR